MSGLSEMSFSQIVGRCRSAALTPLDVVEECLQRIDRWEGQLRAWVHLDRDGAREAAVRHGEALARGDSRGPLHGIPIGVKDIVDVRGMPTRAGSPLTSDSPVERDAPAVARLRKAGAIILGKTVTTEFASFDPPPTRNPWNPRHTPGGSSSGSAAAVAAGMCLGAIGSQTGGSIIRPAGYCGICGCKPTYGTIPTDGVYPFSASLDHLGPLAGSIADLSDMLNVLLGQTAPETESQARRDAPPRLGFVETYFPTETNVPVAREIRKAADALRAAGAKIQSITLPSRFDHVHRMHRTIMLYEAVVVHRKQFEAHADQYSPKIAALLREGWAIDTASYHEALEHQRHFQDDMSQILADVDALVTPATPTTAPASLDTTGDPKFNSPWTYSGLPVVSLPCGVADDGMPVALQMIGRAHSEAGLLAAAAWCEQQLAFNRVPPMVASSNPDRTVNSEAADS